MHTVFPWLLAVVAICPLALAEDVRIAKGDYEAALTANGLEVRYKGVRIVCAGHLTVHKPGWTGSIYSGLRRSSSSSAKLEASDGRIVISDTAPSIDGQIVQELKLDESGLEISLRIRIGQEIEPSPCEYAPVVLDANVFAGEQYRMTGLLGKQNWQRLPAEKPKQTGPGTLMLRSNVFGLELMGQGVAVNVESVRGPAPTFYDMRSRSYAPAQRNYWLLHSWAVRRGEYLVTTRLSARPTDRPGQVQAVKLWVRDGEKRHEARTIAIDAGAHAVERAAAAELQQYLSKMGVRGVPIVECHGKKPLANGVIYVGKSGPAAQKGLFREGEIKALGTDGFVVRSKGGNVLAAGHEYRGSVYAVCRLLEELGCRFYARELEVVPGGRPAEIPDQLSVSDSAAFEWRAMYGAIDPLKCSLSPGEWTARVGSVDLPKMMAIPKGGFWHHTMGFLLPAQGLAESSPDLLAQIRGQRAVVKAAVQQYCLSNPELLRRMTEAVLRWIADDPDRLYYPVHYGDVARFCECEQCKAMYAEKGSVTDAAIWFDNQIAKEVARRFPGKFLTILAYHSTRRAPVKVKPEPNLLIIFCAIVECQGRPWTAPTNLKRNVCSDLDDWIAIHPLGPKGIITFDYPTTYHFAGFPYPALYAYVENIRYYHKLGLRGVYVCGIGRWKHLEHVYSYVMPRIMWNPSQDLAALIAEFTQTWYGRAWRPMRDYVEMLHRGAMESQSEGVMDCHAGPNQRFFRELYTPEFLAKALRLFQDAEALADDPFVTRRILKDKWGLLFVALFLHGKRGADLVPAATESGIVRETPRLTDYRKVSEFLRINRLFNRPWDMEPRRRFTLASLVGFEPRAQPWWADARIREIMEDPDAAYRKQTQDDQQVSRRLVTLANERLKVVIIPELGGRIWRLYDRRSKRDVLWRGTVSLSALERGVGPDPYVNFGGYEEYVGEEFASPGWSQPYQCRTAQDGRTAVLTATLPKGLKLTRTVSLSEGRVMIESIVRNTSSRPLKGVVLRAHPQILRDRGTAPELRVKGERGMYSRIPFKNETYLSGNQLPFGAWAVRFPKAGLSVTNEFDPQEVATCFLYIGPQFFNLELFSRKKDLAPGGQLRLAHSYRVAP